MATTTVQMIGIGDLRRIPDYLAHGAVVVVAPDRTTLRRWEYEIERAGPPPEPPPAAVPGLSVDLVARRIGWNEETLPLTPLEFRILATLAGQPGRAWSFEELKASGWGELPHDGVDVFAVRSVIQRLRRKLRATKVEVSIESVRAFGFRLEPRSGSAGQTELMAVP
jgi:DNA-binding response OmpR family regulator